MAICWGVLAWSVWSMLGGSWRGLLGAWSVALFSLSAYILQWDSSVLTESISLSAVALFFAASIWLCRQFTWPRVALLVFSLLLEASARDESVPVMFLVGVAFVVAAVVCFWRRSHLDSLCLAITGVLLLLVVSTLGLAATTAHRNLENTENNFIVRVWPYPSADAWFSHHGMPESSYLVTIDTALRAHRTWPYSSVVVPPKMGALVVTPIWTEPRWTPLYQWLQRRGETQWLLYLVSHPGYVLSAPLRHPQLSFNSPTSLSFYAKGRQASELLPLPFVPGLVVFLVALCSGGLLVVRRLLFTRLPIVFIGLILVGIFAMAASWYGDSEELARHMIEGNVTVRLAALLLALSSISPRRIETQTRGIRASSRTACERHHSTGDRPRRESDLGGSRPKAATNPGSSRSPVT